MWFAFSCLFLVITTVSSTDLISNENSTLVSGNKSAVIIVKPSDITYYFCSQNNKAGSPIKYNTISATKHVFDPKKDTVIQIHGWLSGNNSNFNTAVKNALLSKHDVNVIVVDWGKVAGDEYIIAKTQMVSVGRFAAEFLSSIIRVFNYPLSKLKLVGHSLGAHVSGVIGKHFSGKLEQIVAIDPAGPLIDHDESRRLEKTDAKFVQVIHTSSGKTGMKSPVGHADYYPNGGVKQPGCGIDLIGTCAHSRSYWLYAESLRNNQFYAKRCTSYATFEARKCTQISIMGGYNVDKSASGIYYLDTNSKSPYGKGKI